MGVNDFISRQRWIFSKTYAEKAPHEYIVRDKIDGTNEEFDEFVMFIRQYGFPASFWGKTHIYLPFDGRYYWTMGAPVKETIIINRCRQDGYELFMRRKNGNILQGK